MNPLILGTAGNIREQRECECVRISTSNAFNVLETHACVKYASSCVLPLK